MDLRHFLCFALFSLTLVESSVSADTLSANQSLADGEFLISPNQIFEMGFFSPGSSFKRFLGVWYKATPEVVVWVANRGSAINGSDGVLSLQENGALFITSNSTVIWSSNSSKVASNPILQLLDNGNLVVAVGTTTFIWQSFDYPTDTRLPGMKVVQDPVTKESKYLTSWRGVDDPSMGEFKYLIENEGLSQTIIVKGREKLNRVVFWNGNFVGYPSSKDPAWKVEVVTNGGRLVSVLQPFYGSVHARLTMNYSGSLQRFVMNENKDGWILMIALPHDICDNYGVCGPNGICKIYKNPACECLRGYNPTSEREWSVFDWRGGCRRNLTLDCQNEEGFLEVEGIKFPDSITYRLDTNLSIDECRGECLKKCNCTAYANPYFNNGSGCMTWFGDLIDMREYTTESGPAPSIFIRVPLSELDQNKKKKPAGTKIKVIVAVSCLGMLILCLSVLGLFLRMRKRREGNKTSRVGRPENKIWTSRARRREYHLSSHNFTHISYFIIYSSLISIIHFLNSHAEKKTSHFEREGGSTFFSNWDRFRNNGTSQSGKRVRNNRNGDPKDTNDDLELPLFDLATIQAAIDNFSEEKMIGQGGFGPVYKGNLPLGQVIAVKRMSKISVQGHEEYKTEVNLIAKLQHRNLVKILGCCV